MDSGLLWRIAFIVNLALKTGVCSKFELCGKTQGILTASKGAAFASKYMQKCGKSLILNYPWTTPKMIKVAEKACLGMQLCYAHHDKKKQKVKYPNPSKTL
ncbi:hypothetical protein MTO96_009342 [Rhipicephalus appendiculatus]